MKHIALHILQSFPATCLNRDDVGAPKSLIFGGATRARVSSQCWKRAIRLLARESSKEHFAGERTLRAAEELAERLIDLKVDNAKSLAIFVCGSFLSSKAAATSDDADNAGTEELSETGVGETEYPALLLSGRTRGYREGGVRVGSSTEAKSARNRP